MSKTERALDGEDAALDELDDFVASEAAAADRAIGELIDDAVDRRNGGNGSHGGNGRNGSGNGSRVVFDEPPATGDLQRPAASTTVVADDAELELLEAADVSPEVDDERALDDAELDVPHAEVDTADQPELDDAAEIELDDEVEGDSFELLHLDSLVETYDGVVDEELQPEPDPPAAVEPDVADVVEVVPLDADVRDDDPSVEAVDTMTPDAEESVAGPDDVQDATADTAEAGDTLVETEQDDGIDDVDLAALVTGPPAALTPPVGLQRPPQPTTPVAREGDQEVSDDILEELRRADIDGPTVAFAPQDDTTSARRRPKRRADYDPAPMPIPARPPRLLGRKPRVRKVTRVVRHVDPWSVFKIAAVASMVLYAVLLTAGVLLWNVAYATGTIDNVERFFESFGWSTFEFNGGEIYHAAWIMGLFGAIGLTGIAVLAATLFNLITDIVGGMRFTVLEEEVVETRTSPMRRFVIRRPEPEVPAVVQDRSGQIIREAPVDDSGAINR